MAKNKPEPEGDTPYDVLKKLAEAARFPPADDSLAVAYPELWALFAPGLVRVSAGDGKVKDVVREPFVSIQWSSILAGWQVSLTDRVWKYKLIFAIRDLSSMWEEMNEACKNKKVRPVPLRKRGG